MPPFIKVSKQKNYYNFVKLASSLNGRIRRLVNKSDFIKSSQIAIVLKALFKAKTLKQASVAIDCASVVVPIKWMLGPSSSGRLSVSKIVSSRDPISIKLKAKRFFHIIYLQNMRGTDSPTNCLWKQRSAIYWKQTVAVFLCVKGLNIIAWMNRFWHQSKWFLPHGKGTMPWWSSPRKRVNKEMKGGNRMKVKQDQYRMVSRLL